MFIVAGGNPRPPPLKDRPAFALSILLFCEGTRTCYSKYPVLVICYSPLIAKSAGFLAVKKD